MKIIEINKLSKFELYKYIDNLEKAIESNIFTEQGKEALNKELTFAIVERERRIKEDLKKSPKR